VISAVDSQEPGCRSVLVIGSSSGIGEACALHLASKGWDVFAGVRQPRDAERLRESASGSLSPVTLDVTDESSIDSALAEVSERTSGRLTAVLNNAGVAIGGPLEYLSLEEWRRQLEVNVIGPVAVTRACLPLIRRSGRGGRVVFIGSIGGRIATPLVAPYAASKFALEAIAESLRHELRSAGIKVVLIEPGAVRTPIWDKGQSRADEMENEYSPDALGHYRRSIDGLRKNMQMQARNGVPPAHVADVVYNVLTATKPRARYLVGADAVAMAAVSRLPPDVARDALVRIVTRS